MKCEKCGGEVIVLYSIPIGTDKKRDKSYPVKIKRRRVCKSCNNRFNTIEPISQTTKSA